MLLMRRLEFSVFKRLVYFEVRERERKGSRIYRRYNKQSFSI